MSCGKQYNEVKLVAFDYYDGVTEGVASAIKNLSTCYFKLIAWDQDQDERLYAVTEVDKGQYKRLLDLLSNNGEDFSAPVWVPKWNFDETSDEVEANGIVESFKMCLKKSKLMALGRGVCGECLRIIPIDAETAKSVEKVIESERPEELSKWSSVIS